MGRKRLRLNLDRIIASLTAVQTDFAAINARLSVKRETLTDEIVQNLAAAYHYLDRLVAEGVEVFPDATEHLLELNHIVLCGADPLRRMEYAPHLQATRHRFFTMIQPLKRWHQKHGDDATVKVAAQLYVGVLSQPQLFIEGNHRTGGLIASYLLLMGGKDPFVLNPQNAVAYFEPSSRIKFTDKRSIKGRLKLPKYEKGFKEFLEENIHLTKGYYVLP